MRRPIQTLLIVCLLLCALKSTGQFNLPVRFNNNLKPVIEKVLDSWPDNYRGILGDTISVSINEIVFASKVQPESAESSIVTEYLSNGKHDYAWQSVIVRSEDLNSISKKYSSACQQVKNLSFRTAGVSSRLQGEYEAPNNTKNFYSSIFAPASNDPAVENLRVEVLLQSDITGWVLTIQIYNKVHNDKEGNMN